MLQLYTGLWNSINSMHQHMPLSRKCISLEILSVCKNRSFYTNRPFPKRSIKPFPRGFCGGVFSRRDHVMSLLLQEKLLIEYLSANNEITGRNYATSFLCPWLTGGFVHINTVPSHFRDALWSPGVNCCTNTWFCFL